MLKGALYPYVCKSSLSPTYENLGDVTVFRGIVSHSSLVRLHFTDGCSARVWDDKGG